MRRSPHASTPHPAPLPTYKGSASVYWPHLELDAADRPVVAGNREEAPQALLRRWDGESWEEAATRTSSRAAGHEPRAPHHSASRRRALSCSALSTAVGAGSSTATRSCSFAASSWPSA